MKRLLLLIVCAVAALGLISAGYSAHKFRSGKVSTYIPTPLRSSGAAMNGLGDRTGSPVAGAGSSCTNCHSGGSYSPSISITVYDAGLNAVTEYIPGNLYKVEYSVTAGTGSPWGFGFQSILLNSSNQTTGNLVATITSNAQIVSTGGHQFIEHSGVSSSGVFSAEWTAPSGGTGNVSIYARGMAVNQDGGTSGDQASGTQILTLTEVVPTTISYPGTPFCDNEPNQTPVQTGETGGVFSSQLGLDINPTSGIINVGNSTLGTYQVDYQYSMGTTSFSVTINPTYNESASATICDNETLTFGTQTLGASDAGLNTEVFQSINGCDSTVTLDLTINSSSSSTQTQTGIDSYTWPVNNETYTESGTYTAVIPNASGCDSTITLDLTLQFTGLDENESSYAAVYPNPTFNSFTLSTKDMIHMNYTLVDIQGKVVLTGKIESTEETVDISILSKGQYNLVFEDESISPISIIKN